MRTIGVVTVARSDYGFCLPILRRIQQDPELSLSLFVTGMHLSPEFGMTVRDIERDGFLIDERVDMILSSDTPEGTAKSMGLGTIGFAQAYARSRPDILLILGDRFEMHAAAVAAVPMLIPIAHIDSGAITEGAIDDVFRHSITKMSHLHFAQTQEYARRTVQMGEEPQRVFLTGAPSLDNLREMTLLGQDELKQRFDLDLESPTLIVTYHPVTLEAEQTAFQVRELLAALKGSGSSVVFTYPNADAQGREITEQVRQFCGRHPRAQVVANLGTRAYFSLMSHASAMVGNSSSGIVEAASFKLPVVNIGNRQKGRVHGKNVINVAPIKDEIQRGIARAVSPDFRAGLDDLANPYGDGHASELIVNALKNVTLDADFLKKTFHDQ